MDVIISVLSDYFRVNWLDVAAIALVFVLSFIIVAKMDPTNQK